jgi:orotate phosphoribosyltransferase
MIEALIKVIFPLEVVVTSITITLIVAILLYYSLRVRRSKILVAPGIGRSSWIMVSGTKSGVYYDIDKASSKLENMESISQWYIENVKEIMKKTDVDFLAFIEREDGPVGAITKKDKISQELSIQSFIVRPRRRIHASRLKGVSSKELKGKKIVIISDVASTGRSIKKVVEILTEYQASIAAIVVVVYRRDHAIEPDLETFCRKRSIDFRYSDDNLKRYSPA